MEKLSFGALREVPKRTEVFIGQRTELEKLSTRLTEVWCSDEGENKGKTRKRENKT